MMKGGMAGLMKQAQQMQEKMQKMQEELANAEVTGQSGAGLVSVVMTGRHDVKRVSLDDSLMQEDKEILEDLIAAAVNDAVRKIEQNNQKRCPASPRACNCRPASRCPSDSAFVPVRFLGRRPAAIPLPLSDESCMSFSPLIRQLIESLRILPGVGQKSAQRMALMLLERDRSGGPKLAQALTAAMEGVGHCRQCRTLSEEELCPQCADPRRDDSLLCVVEGPLDVFAVEQTGYRGRYFVLKGTPVAARRPGAGGDRHSRTGSADQGRSLQRGDPRHQPHRGRRGHRPLYRPATGRPRPDLVAYRPWRAAGWRAGAGRWRHLGPRPGRTAADLLSSVPPVSVGRAAYTPSPMASFSY